MPRGILIRCCLALAALALASSGAAEDPAQLALKVADAHAANFAQLQSYAWNIDSEFIQEGAVKGHVVANWMYAVWSSQ